MIAEQVEFKEEVLSDAALSKDRKKLVEFAELQMPDQDIAMMIGRPVEVVKKRLRYDVDLNRLKGQVKLLKAQFDKALSGNTNMLIWLGKHYLNQREDVHLNTLEPEVRLLFEQIERLGYERDQLLNKPYYSSEVERKIEENDQIERKLIENVPGSDRRAALEA